MADEPDPWEPFNRRMYYFNYQIERLIITPIVNTYKFITPDFVEDRISNFFKNAKVLNTMANTIADSSHYMNIFAKEYNRSVKKNNKRDKMEAKAARKAAM